MQQQGKQYIRDSEELEGALLPSAVPVANNGEANAEITTATAVPTTYFSYDNAEGKELQEAPVIPDPNAERGDERYSIVHGTRKGQISAEQEKEDIQRNNRKVFTIDYNMRQQIQDANEIARIRNLAEERGLTQTSYAMPKEKVQSKPPAKAPEFYYGTYGKDYEVSPYDTSEYDTTDYNMSEYKSLYET